MLVLVLRVRDWVLVFGLSGLVRMAALAWIRGGLAVWRAHEKGILSLRLRRQVCPKTPFWGFIPTIS